MNTSTKGPSDKELTSAVQREFTRMDYDGFKNSQLFPMFWYIMSRVMMRVGLMNYMRNVDGKITPYLHDNTFDAENNYKYDIKDSMDLDKHPSLKGISALLFMWAEPLFKDFEAALALYDDNDEANWNKLFTDCKSKFGGAGADANVLQEQLSLRINEAVKNLADATDISEMMPAFKQYKIAMMALQLLQDQMREGSKDADILPVTTLRSFSSLMGQLQLRGTIDATPPAKRVLDAIQSKHITTWEEFKTEAERLNSLETNATARQANAYQSRALKTTTPVPPPALPSDPIADLTKKVSALMQQNRELASAVARQAQPTAGRPELSSSTPGKYGGTARVQRTAEEGHPVSVHGLGCSGEGYYSRCKSNVCGVMRIYLLGIDLGMTRAEAHANAIATGAWRNWYTPLKVANKLEAFKAKYTWLYDNTLPVPPGHNNTQIGRAHV